MREVVAQLLLYRMLPAKYLYVVGNEKLALIRLLCRLKPID